MLALAGGRRVDYGLAGQRDEAYLDISPFGLSYAAGTSSAELTIYLRNARPVGMTVSPMYSHGSDASTFVRTVGNCPSQTPFYLPASAPCTISYRFVHYKVGWHLASASIFGSGSFGFSLSGDGLPEAPLFINGFEAAAPAAVP